MEHLNLMVKKVFKNLVNFPDIRSDPDPEPAIPLTPGT